MQKANAATKQLQTEKAAHEYKSSPVAFVLCKNEVSREQMIVDLGKIEFEEKLQAKQAAPIKEVLWENLGSNRTKTSVLSVIMTILFLILVFLLFTPTTFVQIVENYLPEYLGPVVG